ncbi:MAG TPA: MBOAT family protein [Clostridiales bacterium]|nr:MBOAT family protein [Clostridiales bacterium]
MIFSSTLFLFIFLPATLLAYYAIPAKHLKARNIVLLCASLIFYAWGEPKNIILMLLSIAANYVFGLLIGKFAENSGKKKLVLVLSIVFNLGMLGYYKYWNLFTFGKLWEVALPIGISFFTFQIMSYVIDVYRDEVAVQRSLFKLGLYISLFPQLIAGPIVRYADIELQLSERTTDLKKFASGIRRFIVGFSKKVLIANVVAVPTDTIFALESRPAATAWLGIICYALQIYFDFSGYSDMAIGLGRMFGFEFLENFDYPYISTSVREFWRRWHISLSTWFRDYLYIPLGGNRRGKLRTYINLVIVFACTGFWHGASWSFLIWGLYHGFFLVVERLGFGKVLERLPKFIGRMYTLLAVLFGWVLFRADNLTLAIKYMGDMLNFANFGLTHAVSQLDNLKIITIIAGIIASMPVLGFIKKQFEKRGERGEATASVLSTAVCAVMFCFAIICLTGSDYNPFIYFRF